LSDVGEAGFDGDFLALGSRRRAAVPEVGCNKLRRHLMVVFAGAVAAEKP